MCFVILPSWHDTVNLMCAVSQLSLLYHDTSQHARPSGVLHCRSDGLECAAWRPPTPVAQCRQFQEDAKDASVSECNWTLSTLEALHNALYKFKTYLLTYSFFSHQSAQVIWVSVLPRLLLDACRRLQPTVRLMAQVDCHLVLFSICLISELSQCIYSFTVLTAL